MTVGATSARGFRRVAAAAGTLCAFAAFSHAGTALAAGRDGPSEGSCSILEARYELPEGRARGEATIRFEPATRPTVYTDLTVVLETTRPERHEWRFSPSVSNGYAQSFLEPIGIDLGGSLQVIWLERTSSAGGSGMGGGSGVSGEASGLAVAPGNPFLDSSPPDAVLIPRLGTALHYGPGTGDGGERVSVPTEIFHLACPLGEGSADARSEQP